MDMTRSSLFQHSSLVGTLAHWCLGSNEHFSTSVRGLLRTTLFAISLIFTFEDINSSGNLK